MAVTKDDFEKIWASQSPLTPYSFSDSQYKEGWNFVGSTPPSRQMWDAFMQNADEKLKYLYQHEDIPLGHEYFTFNPNVPQGSLPLLGGVYDRETYADLWSWVQEQTGYLKTEAEWQTLSTANNGNVPYYSDGDGSTTFRVPSLKCWIKGANGTVSEVGSYLEAGLPNITGAVGVRVYGNANSLLYSPSGAIEITSQSIQNDGPSDGGTSSVNMPTISFDASRSNPVYGNANTVVPESIVGMWLVKAYGVIVDTGTIDEQAYIDDRFNASKQYTDDEVNDAVTTLNSDISAINTRLGTILEASGNATTVDAYATLCSITTHPAGVWLVTSFMDVNYSSTNIYIHIIAVNGVGQVSTRNVSNYGGGNCAVWIGSVGENVAVELQGYQTQAGTMSGNLKMVQLA